MGVRPVGVSLGSLSKYFPQHEIEAILRASGREGQRRRKLPTLDLMYYLIALGLHASEGCRSVLRRIMLRRGGREETSSGCAATRRLRKVGLDWDGSRSVHCTRWLSGRSRRDRVWERGTDAGAW